MPDHPGGLRPPPLLKRGGENNILPPAGILPPARILSPAGIRLGALPPLALYVHIPWCVKKCPYCDFNSHQARGDVPEKAYVEALVADLELTLPDVWGRRVTSIFFGGGTPSLFSAAAIETLISAFRARLSLAADCEITLEANPGTFEAEKFHGYREAGVNRLSIGIQSFNPQHLKALGRIHDDKEARRAIEIAKTSFDNVNLDLMYALPQQTPEEARADVEAALEAGTTHLSFYHLTLEPNTLFYRHPPALPDEDASAAMQDMIVAALAARGYAHYETSAWARPGRECRHNLNYWRFGDYLGIGAGAHGKLSFSDRVTRTVRYKQPKEYLQRAAEGRPVQDSHELGRDDLVFEFMMNALRLPDGFPVSSFAERTGLQIAVAEKPLREAETRGLIARDHERIRPTDLGQRFLNDLLQLFLPDAK
ncbi:MAG: oxygen-independent coproporphyrinogen III oxidase-like protein [Betaproteobacteria bacterium]|nr:MAG: oxygen-independent coproporphyrinogen III oxidase-like protein [Betaproteobacteria bacterium]